ncbi:MAG TPA: efflux RND transporter periplasmic adaptor subunit [Candidatus Binataceae bacterium]|jgi:membrane fusion protein (multidrug efflux system)|nr:efflux RND transporter periplasmic adaptor subunit [Candidatus Binataceae bacterium]
MVPLPPRNIVAGLAMLVCAVIATAGCKQAAPAAPPPPVPEVVVTDVIKKDVPVYSEWVGTTEGFVNAEIHPQISGYLLKQNYKDGDHVRAGQALFQIDDRGYRASLDQALADEAQKEADYQKNRQDLARYLPLYQQQVISKQEFDHVNQNTRATAAAVQSAQAAVATARLNEQWTQVNSPIEGIASIAKAQVGDLVNSATLLTTVSQLDPIKVTFPISEREYLHFAGRIRTHEQHGVSRDEALLEMILADGKTYKYPGHFYVANRQIDASTGTITIQGVFPNPDDLLRPGMYAKIRAATDVSKDTLLVPQEAVLETQGQYQVAVVGADNKVNMRMVKIGKQAGALRIIESGVGPGDRVITQGLQKVSEGMEVRPVPAPVQAGSATESAPASTSGTAGPAPADTQS